MWEREINHIATSRALSLGGELLPPHHGSQQRRWRWRWSRWRWLRGAIPHPVRVPKQRFLSPETCLRWRWCCGTFRGWRLHPLGFLPRGKYIGGRARSVDARGAHTIGLRGQGWARTTLWCGLLSAPLHLCFGLCWRVGKNRRLDPCFVQFREYFLVIMWNRKTAENRNWHYGILLIG
jgi:hypothetical protein